MTMMLIQLNLKEFNPSKSETDLNEPGSGCRSESVRDKELQFDFGVWKSLSSRGQARRRR